MSSSVFTLTNRLNYLQAQVNGIIANSDTLQDVIDNGDSLQATAPTLDQVIKYDGTNVVWSDLPAPPASQSLQEVITVSDELQATAPTLDQVIKYDGTNVVWSDLPAPPASQSLQEVINVSDVLNGDAPIAGQFIGYNGGTTVWSDLPAPTLESVVVESPDLDGSPPTTNQVIQYDGEFVVWADLPATSTPSLQDVITVNDDLQSTAPTLNQVIKYDGTNVVWSDLPAPPATPTLSSVLSAGNTASGTSASVTLTNLPKQTIISPTSVFLNDTTIVQQATLNTEKLRLLTSGLTNDITSGKMSFTKPATSSINEYGTDGISLSGLFGAETRSGGFNLNTGLTTSNATTKLTGTLNEAFVSLDGNNSSTILGTKSTLNATGLTCLNKVTQTSNSSLSSSGLTVGITGSTVTVNSSGVSSTNILNLNSSSQIDTNCSIRVLAPVNPSAAGRSTLSNGQLVMQNVSAPLQNTISSTSSAITNGTKTISMTVDGLSSTGAMSLGTATVALTTGSTGITQTYPSNTTALATTQYVTTAIGNIPASATPTLQSVLNEGNTATETIVLSKLGNTNDMRPNQITIANATKTITVNPDGLDSTGEIVIGNVSGTTQLNGTTTATQLKSDNFDSVGPNSLVKLADSLTTGDLQMGNKMTTGNIKFGTQMTTGNINIMNDVVSSGNILMLNASATGKLIVRGAGIDSNTILASEVKSNTINATSAVQDLDIGSNLQDTTISIGRLMIADGRVEIGSTASTINLVSNDCNAATQTTGNNTTRVATCAFVNSSIAAIPVPTLQAVINKNDDLQGTTPALNQVIKYNGSNVIWSDLPAQTTPSLQAVVNVSDVLNGGAPATNQYIKYNGSVVTWSDLPAPPATPSLSAVLLAGNGAGTSNLNMNSQNITAVNNITVSTINSAPYPPPASVNTLQQVLDAGNTANKTIVLSDGSFLNDITPSQINITNDAGTEQLVLSNQNLIYTTDTGVSTLNNVNLGIRNTDNSINSNLTKDSLTFTTTAGTNNSFSSSGAVLAGFVNEELKNCSMTVEGGFFNQNTINLKESNFTESTLYLLDDTNKTNRTLSLATGLLQEINTDEIALGTKSLLSDSTLTLINKETSEITTIIPSSSTITDGTNTSVIYNAGIGFVEPITDKSTYYNLNDFLISKTVGTVSTSSGSSSETLTLGKSDSVLLTSSTNQLTAENIVISNPTNSITFNPLSFIYNTITTNWSDIVTNAVLALYASLAGINVFTGASNTFENSVIVKASPSAVISNTLSDTGMSLTDTVGASTRTAVLNNTGFTLNNTLQNRSISMLVSNSANSLNVISNASKSTITAGLLTNSDIVVPNNRVEIGKTSMAIYSNDATDTLGITKDSMTSNIDYTIGVGAGKNLSLGGSNLGEIVSVGFQSGRTGNVNIGNGSSSSGAINLGNGLSYTGTINFGNGTGSSGDINIGNGSTSTANVNIATQAGRSNVLHLGDGNNNIAGSSVHINNGNNSVGSTQINNGSGQTGQINIGNATSGTTTTNIKGNTNIEGVVNVNGSGSTNTDLVTIGNSTAGGITTLSSPTINIGNADTATTMNATNIKQVIKTVGGSLIENTIGNTTVASSLSTTFNRKLITPVGGAVNCYTITANASDQFTNQYFEIYVSGANGGRGGYTYKGCFGVEKRGGGTIANTSVSTLFYYGTGVSPPTSTVIPVVDFTLAGQVLTVRVNTSGGGSTNQNFVTTLTSYPTASIRNTANEILEDFIITAV